MNSPAKVYFTNMRAKHRHSLLDKFDLLMKKAGIGQIDFDNKFTAIKLHFGEPGNLGFVRPNYAERVVSQGESWAADPSSTDCNVMYWENAATQSITSSPLTKRFQPLVTGAHVIIADGLTAASLRSAGQPQTHQERQGGISALSFRCHHQLDPFQRPYGCRFWRRIKEHWHGWWVAPGQDGNALHQ